MRNNTRSSSIVGSVLMPGILALACASGTASADHHMEGGQAAGNDGAAGEVAPSSPAVDNARSNFEEPSEALPEGAPAMDEPPARPSEADAPEWPAAQDGAPDMDPPVTDEAPEARPAEDESLMDEPPMRDEPMMDDPREAPPEEAPTMDADPEMTDPDMTDPGMTEDAVEAPAEEPEMAPEPGPRGQVSRGQFTSAIENREPVDNLTQVDANTDQVLFFSEIMDHEGGEIIHRWRYRDDQDMGDIHFDVEGPRWRIWSTKTLDPEWTGPWRVEVVTQDGEILDTYRFELR